MKSIPIFGDFQSYFKPDKVIIDNILFRLHHQVSFFILIAGILFIFVENHFNGKAITCQGENNYRNKYCWIHGTGYVAQNLQGKATGCFVNQEGLDDDHTPKITYYLWLPFLLVACIGLAKLSRTVWKLLEGGLINSLVKHESSPEKLVAVFHEYKLKKFKLMLYQVKFVLCEIINMVAVVASMAICNRVILNKFWNYGTEVTRYQQQSERAVEELKITDPMCQLFPTEVSCEVKTGGITQVADTWNGICILSNNIFNQHYFLLLWFWWVILLALSCIFLVIRIAMIAVPSFGKMVLTRQIGNSALDKLDMTSGDWFVLSLLNDNLGEDVMDNVVDEVVIVFGVKNDVERAPIDLQKVVRRDSGNFC